MAQGRRGRCAWESARAVWYKGAWPGVDHLADLEGRGKWTLSPGRAGLGEREGRFASFRLMQLTSFLGQLIGTPSRPRQPASRVPLAALGDMAAPVCNVAGSRRSCAPAPRRTGRHHGHRPPCRRGAGARAPGSIRRRAPAPRACTARRAPALHPGPGLHRPVQAPVALRSGGGRTRSDEPVYAVGKFTLGAAASSPVTTRVDVSL